MHVCTGNGGSIKGYVRLYREWGEHQRVCTLVQGMGGASKGMYACTGNGGSIKGYVRLYREWGEHQRVCAFVQGMGAASKCRVHICEVFQCRHYTLTNNIACN